MSRGVGRLVDRTVARFLWDAVLVLRQQKGMYKGGVPMSGRGHEEGEVRERDTESKRGLAGSALASSIFVGGGGV